MLNFFFSVTHAAKGWVGTEAGLDAVVLKDFELASKQDPQKQVDGYLALIRQTSGPPITVASVGLPNFEHVGSVAMGRLAFDTYLVAYFGENREQLAHSMHEASSRVYGLRTLRGLARLLLNRPVTVTV